MSNYEPVMILNAHGIELPEEEEKVRYIVTDNPGHGWDFPCESRVQDLGINYQTREEGDEVHTACYCEDQDSANLVCFALNLLNAAQKRANARGKP